MPTDSLRPGLASWLIVAFDGGMRDPRPLLKAEYDGLQIYIKPSAPESEWADLISVFVEPGQDSEGVLLRINRFLSAMAWKDGLGYKTLGNNSSACRPTDRDEPRFNYGHPRDRASRAISRLDFEHLQNPPRDDQKLALALYRDGLASNNVFYQFLSFYKVINISYSTGPEQKAWINRNISHVGRRQANSRKRLDELQATGLDVGEYLYEQGRCAIAHASYLRAEPVRDPDRPADQREISKDLDLMQELAQILIEQELGVPSINTIWREHLYELAGFKVLFGQPLVSRLMAGESVPASDFPELPRLTITLKDKPEYEGLKDLRFSVREYQESNVLLTSDPGPTSAALVLNFPREELTFAVEELTVNRSHPAYSKPLEASLWRFLIDYFKNGYLEVRESPSGERLSYKTAFLPVNIDSRATLRNFEETLNSLLDPNDPSGTGP